MHVVTTGAVHLLCRSDPTLQHGHSHSGIEATQRAPPSDGPGTSIIRDGSIKSLVSCYENKVQEVSYTVQYYYTRHKSCLSQFNAHEYNNLQFLAPSDFVSFEGNRFQ